VTPAADARDAVRRALGGRRLIWVGIRGEDGEALRQLPELKASFATIAQLRSGALPAGSNVTLESLLGRRPDLDAPDFDLESTDAAREFRRLLMREVSGRCVVMTYRPTSLVAALAFSMAETMTLAGMFRDRQQAFENKPWVETRLALEGVRGLVWRYVANEHRSRVKNWVGDRPHVLRASRSSGGVGIALVNTPEEVEALWPQEPDEFVAVAPYLDASISVNLSGCVFDDGAIRLHPVSVQLIGIASCTSRPFGYCGNDFAAAASIDDDLLDEIDALGRRVGTWLYGERYRGAFGIDALIHEGNVHFTEINARFQGSSSLSAEIAADLDTPDLFIDHLAATLGVPAQAGGLSVKEWARSQPDVAQIVVHNTTPGGLRLDEATPLPDHTSGVRLAQVARGVTVDPGATLCRATVPRRVTTTGVDLDPATEAIVGQIADAFAREGLAA
jgi:hypothetical protein